MFVALGSLDSFDGIAPMLEMFTKPVMRTLAGRTTNSRKPSTVSAPAEPASFHVVTPERDATGSGSMPQ